MGSRSQTSAAARAFSELLGDKVLSRVDARTTATTTLTARPDFPTDVRAKQRTTSRAREEAPSLFRKCQGNADAFRHGVHGFQGLIHLAPQSDRFELFWVKGSENAGFIPSPCVLR